MFALICIKQHNLSCQPHTGSPSFPAAFLFHRLECRSAAGEGGGSDEQPRGREEGRRDGGRGRRREGGEGWRPYRRSSLSSRTRVRRLEPRAET
ncbi:hypothetical protein AOLI_G00059700 [Acnodon oligacanthus]